MQHSFDPEMGCCFCRPQTDVTDDPRVVAYAEVGYAVVFDDLSEQFNILDSTSGMFYVRSGILYFEATEWDSFCCKCERKEWELSEIRQIEVVQKHITVTSVSGYYGTSQSRVTVNLKIAFSNCTTLFAAMPSADTFCARLRQHISNCRLLQNEIQELVQQAIAQADACPETMELTPLTTSAD